MTPFILLQFYVVRVDAPAGGPTMGGGCFVTVESGPWLGHVEALQWAGRAQQPQVTRQQRKGRAAVRPTTQARQPMRDCTRVCWFACGT